MMETVEIAATWQFGIHSVAFVSESVAEIVVLAAPAPEFVAETVDILELGSADGQDSSSVAFVNWTILFLEK